MKLDKKFFERFKNDLTEEEVNVIKEYQKRLPILIDNEGKLDSEFCIDARELWNELGRPLDTTGNDKEFTKWIKRRIETTTKEGSNEFVIDKDYKISSCDKNVATISCVYSLTLEN